ncbi:uncharacterized protein LOC135081358 [Ostrinia nubilalis]|uniref:uncharacterized protein LOC135081358 n=1 Tax=Ostrinia nubilalis TaxID=29057 RepID=UPI00308251FF
MEAKGVVLNGGNWPAWRLQTTIMLKARGLYEVVTVEKPEKGDRAMIEQWEARDSKAQELIVLRVDEEVLNYLATCETSKEMWVKLTNLYESKSKVGVHLIQQKFYNLKYEGPMAKFLSNVEEIVTRLKTMKEEISEKMVVTKIIMSLPSSYKHFVSAWESVPESEQTISNLSARLLVEEESCKVEEEEVTAALVSNSKKKMSENKCYNFKGDCKNR